MEYQSFQTFKGLFLIPGLTSFSIGLEYQITIAADPVGQAVFYLQNAGDSGNLQSIHWQPEGDFCIPFVDVLPPGTAGTAVGDYRFAAEFFFQGIDIHFKASGAEYNLTGAAFQGKLVRGQLKQPFLPLYPLNPIPSLR